MKEVIYILYIYSLYVCTYFLMDWYPEMFCLPAQLFWEAGGGEVNYLGNFPKNFGQLS